MAANLERYVHSRLSEKEAMSMKFDALGVEMLAKMNSDFVQLIKDIQIETENLQSEVTHTEQIIKRYSRSETESQVHSEEQKVNLKQLENLLSWCKNLTGVVMGFDVLGYTVQNIFDHEIMKEYKLHVLCVNIELYITVQLKSDLRVPETNYEIVKLKLEVPEKDVADEIVETLEKLENSRDLVTTIRFLSSYAKERKSRVKIFQQLADDPERSKYVKFPVNDPTSLIITDPDCPGIKINITWQITVNLLFCAHSDLKLSCSVSKSKVATSGTATLEAIPSIFTELTAVKGKQFSIFALVDMMKNS